MPELDTVWDDMPIAQRAALIKTRDAIAAAVPGAHLEFSWGMPTFRIGTDIVMSLTGFKNHNSLFPGAALIELLHKELAGYVTSKGTVHFPKDKPFPVPLLKKILKARIAQINASYPRASGLSKEFFESGQLKVEGKYKNGEMHGAWTWYRKDGSVARSTSYKNGVQAAT